MTVGLCVWGVFVRVGVCVFCGVAFCGCGCLFFGVVGGVRGALGCGWVCVGGLGGVAGWIGCSASVWVGIGCGMCCLEVALLFW